jgi:hypothetical protein
LDLFRQIIVNVLSIKFDGNPSSGNGADTCGQTDMTKVMDAFHDYVIAPENFSFIPEF